MCPFHIATAARSALVISLHQADRKWRAVGVVYVTNSSIEKDWKPHGPLQCPTSIISAVTLRSLLHQLLVAAGPFTASAGYLNGLRPCAVWHCSKQLCQGIACWRTPWLFEVWGCNRNLHGTRLSEHLQCSASSVTCLISAQRLADMTCCR